jgi:hypothetical protein
MSAGDWISVSCAVPAAFVGAWLSYRWDRRQARKRRMRGIEEINRTHPFPGEPGYRGPRP